MFSGQCPKQLSVIRRAICLLLLSLSSYRPGRDSPAVWVLTSLIHAGRWPRSPLSPSHWLTTLALSWLWVSVFPGVHKSLGTGRAMADLTFFPSSSPHNDPVHTYQPQKFHDTTPDSYYVCSTKFYSFSFKMLRRIPPDGPHNRLMC